MSTALPRPVAGDVAPYYFGYVELVPEGDVLAILAGSLAETRRVLRGLAPETETYRYAPEKWSVREVIGHVLDAERVFGNRAFHMARGDRAPLPSMEQDDYVASGGANRRPLTDLLLELEHLRASHLRMFANLDAESWERVGTAAGVPFRVRAFPFILAGHEAHHRRVLAEKYLKGP